MGEGESPGDTWVKFYWVCVAGLSEPLSHWYILWPTIDPILESLLGKCHCDLKNGI